MDSVDLLVVGGGINGAAIARDAAGRGLAVLLVEKGDLAQHTGSASSRLIHALTAGTPTKWGQAGIAIAALAGGFLVLAGFQYAYLFATGALPWPIEGLNVILALQFLPLLAGLALLAVFSRERTGGILTGALIGGLFVSWYVVAGTATHVSI